MAIYYHYSTKAAVEAIRATNIMFPSLRQNRPNDVRYGNGQYFTDIPPGSLTTRELSFRLFGNPNESARLSNYLAIDLSGLQVVRGRSGVFVVPGSKDLDLTGRIVQVGGIDYDLP